jgi:hypothetical protein
VWTLLEIFTKRIAEKSSPRKIGLCTQHVEKQTTRQGDERCADVEAVWTRRVLVLRKKERDKARDEMISRITENLTRLSGVRVDQSDRNLDERVSRFRKERLETLSQTARLLGHVGAPPLQASDRHELRWMWGHTKRSVEHNSALQRAEHCGESQSKRLDL